MRLRPLVLVLFLLLAVTACVQSDSSRNSTAVQTGSGAETPGSTVQTESSTIAAVVNAEVVTKSDLAAVTNIGTIVQSLYLQFPGFVQALLDTPEGKAFLEAYERQILNQLVDSRLLVQQAVLAGATADEAQVTTQVDQQIQKIQSDNQITAEDMESILVQQGSSLAEYTDRLRKTFRERAMVDRLHTKIIQDVTVSDAEIAAYYAEHQSEFAGSDGNALPLDQVKDKIRQTLLAQAQGRRWDAWLTSVRAQATIDIRL